MVWFRVRVTMCCGLIIACVCSTPLARARELKEKVLSNVHQKMAHSRFPYIHVVFTAVVQTIFRLQIGCPKL